MTGGVTLDAGGLIALDRNHRQVLALLVRATELGLRITIPATALAQAMRNPARQARLQRLIRQPLDGLRSNRIQVRHTVHRQLDGARYELLHLFRREADRLGLNGHLRRRELGKNVELRARGSVHAVDEEHTGQRDDYAPIPDREFDECL